MDQYPVLIHDANFHGNSLANTGRHDAKIFKHFQTTPETGGVNQLGVNGKTGKALLPPVMSPDSGPVGENAATNRTSRREGRQ